jgi:hypothetical protein
MRTEKATLDTVNFFVLGEGGPHSKRRDLGDKHLVQSHGFKATQSRTCGIGVDR